MCLLQVCQEVNLARKGINRCCIFSVLSLILLKKVLPLANCMRMRNNHFHTKIMNSFWKDDVQHSLTPEQLLKDHIQRQGLHHIVQDCYYRICVPCIKLKHCKLFPQLQTNSVLGKAFVNTLGCFALAWSGALWCLNMYASLLRNISALPALHSFNSWVCKRHAATGRRQHCQNHGSADEGFKSCITLQPDRVCGFITM